MVAPPGMAALTEHFKNGMYYEVLAWGAVEKHPDAVRQLIAGDNLDADSLAGDVGK